MTRHHPRPAIVAAIALGALGLAAPQHHPRAVRLIAPSDAERVVPTTSTTGVDYRAVAELLRASRGVARTRGDVITKNSPGVGQVPAGPVPKYRNVAPGGDIAVSATAYCETGRMANGQRTYDGAVAANRWPMGTRLFAVELGRTFTVADRYGHGTDFDIAMPGRCGDAIAFGRRTLHVRVVG